MTILPEKSAETVEIRDIRLEQKQIRLFIKREDKLHPHISGNKYRKLYFNLIEARKQNHDTILTFGGAFSNHIAATAAAGKEFGFRTVGIIRGDELKNRPDLIRQNPTLSFALRQGMKLYFVERQTYRERESEHFQSFLRRKFGRFYPVPQGGTNLLGVRGAEKILSPEDEKFDIITTAVGTGGTIAGIVNASFPHQQILGFPALKENYLEREIDRFAVKKNYTLIRDYHFGGFAKINASLIRFINDFYRKTGIPLDPVYTGKMVFGLYDLISKNRFTPGTAILAVHTGGLQGIDGMRRHIAAKKLPPLDVPSFYG